jgi:hypothetical protein
MKRSFSVGAAAILVLSTACGDGTSSGSSANGVAADSCHRQCDAQAKVQGCTPIVGVAECKSLCDQLAASVPSKCKSEFDAYYNCSADEGFTCLGSLPTQSTACKAKMDAFDKCKNGGSASSCAGELDSGVCPSVQCPCPSGVVPVSGFDHSSGSCKCFDTVTCKDLFCN